MTETEKYIILHGLKINTIPPSYRSKWDGVRGKSKPIGALNIRTIMHKVKVYEEALGIHIKEKYKHGTRLAGIIPVREK